MSAPPPEPRVTPVGSSTMDSPLSGPRTTSRCPRPDWRVKGAAGSMIRVDDLGFIGPGAREPAPLRSGCRARQRHAEQDGCAPTLHRRRCPRRGRGSKPSTTGSGSARPRRPSAGPPANGAGCHGHSARGRAARLGHGPLAGLRRAHGGLRSGGVAARVGAVGLGREPRGRSTSASARRAARAAASGMVELSATALSGTAPSPSPTASASRPSSPRPSGSFSVSKPTLSSWLQFSGLGPSSSVSSAASSGAE
jgi:hypothetical protein